MKEMHQGGGGLGLYVLWSVVARATLIPKPSHLHVHTASSCNVNMECCGTYSSPKKKYIKGRVSETVQERPIGRSTLISPT